MKAFRFIISVVLMLISNTLLAQTDFMQIKLKDGTTKEIKVGDIEFVTFVNHEEEKEEEKQEESIVGQWRCVGYDDAGWGDMVESDWLIGDILHFKANGEYTVHSEAGKLTEKGKWKIVREGVVRLYDCIDYTDDDSTILPWNGYYTIEGNRLTVEAELFGFKTFYERMSYE